MTFKIVAIIAVLSAGVVLAASLIGTSCDSNSCLPLCLAALQMCCFRTPQKCRSKGNLLQCIQLVVSSGPRVAAN